jgi:hypothetical protein
MKQLYISLIGAMLFVQSLQAQVGLEGIIVEKYYVADAADSTDAADNFAVYPLHVGATTYRVYADLLPGYKVIQMFGNQNHPLTVSTSTAFYNDPNYGFAVYQGISVNNTKKNTTLIDSYLTVGGVANGQMGVLKVEDTDGSIGNLQGLLANNDPSAGAPITGTNGVDGLMPGSPIVPNTLGLTNELDVFDQVPGSTFTTSGGTIAALGGVEGVTSENRVLLGQFTTEGVFSFKLNLQLATPTAGESQIFVADSALVGEFQDSTLMYTSYIPVVESVASIEANDLNFVAYPNPVKETFIIAQRGGMNADKVLVTITDVSGRIVYQNNLVSSKMVVDASAWTEGFYLVNIQYRSGSETVKIVKN